MTEELPKTIYDVETPCFLVDIDRVKKNCQRMIETCQRLGVKLRPHTKTHKTIEGADLCTEGTKGGIVVSTIAEAEFYADNGYTDILWAHPIVKERISKRVLSLVSRIEMFHVLVESVVGIEGLLATPLPDGKKWSVFLELDCGYGRTGCPWNSADVVTICKKVISGGNTKLQGLYTHCGNTYVMDEQKKKALQQATFDNLTAAKQRLKGEGIEVVNCELGSTPGCSKPLDCFSELTGVHPGNYIFYDYQGVRTQSCEMEDIACKVATTVISHKPDAGTMVVDCGWTAIGQDGLGLDKESAPLGCCPIEGHPELRMLGMSQEIGKLGAAQGDIDYKKYPVGTKLFLYPHHSCASACLHDFYYVHSGEKIIGTWKVVRGW